MSTSVPISLAMDNSADTCSPTRSRFCAISISRSSSTHPLMAKDDHVSVTLCPCKGRLEATTAVTFCLDFKSSSWFPRPTLFELQIYSWYFLNFFQLETYRRRRKSLFIGLSVISLKCCSAFLISAPILSIPASMLSSCSVTFCDMLR